jgi:nanoRNase/pAp phosphatase (c-di-AMP/oligoRNAs hydrolase)
MERFNLKILNEVEVSEEYQVTITKNLQVKNVEDNGDINRAWGIVRENINISVKRVSVIVNRNIIYHGLLRNVQN